MGKDDGDFDDYKVETVNPGALLLFSTILCCMLLLLLAFVVTNRRRDKIESTRSLSEESYGDFSEEEPSSEYKIYEDVKKEGKWKESVDHNTGTITGTALEAGEDKIEVDSTEEDISEDHEIPRGRTRRTGTVLLSPRRDINKIELENEGNDLLLPHDQSVPPAPPTKREIARESRKILGLGLPWMLQSLISEGSSILSVMMISHFMGLNSMLVYSNVWFIIYLAFVMNDAWYNAVYKHVNVSAALGTDDGYTVAGKYAKIGVIGNILLAIPSSALVILYTPDILLWIGYKEKIAEISHLYAIVAVVNYAFDTTTGIIDCVLDIEGHATFGAVYAFWDSLLYVASSFSFILYFSPSLFYLGLFQFGYGIISTIIYFGITHNYCRWFDRCMNGLSAGVFELHGAQVGKLVKMTLPLIIEAIIGNLEHTFFTIFAAHQGTAEAATWVLLSYVWSAVGIAPDSFNAAASCRVARLISKDQAKMARDVSKRAMKQAFLISTVCAMTIYFFRVQFVWCFSLDETLEQMLLEIIPYITLCYPIMVVGYTAMELNDALHLYKRAMVTMGIVTVTVMLPIGYVMTYIYHYNIEGLASAQCIGYTTAGVINIIFFVNADWEKAVTKAQNITQAGVAKKTTFLDGKYDDSTWEDLPEEVRFSAGKFGYTKENWGGGLT